MNHELVMPNNYVSLSEDEMEYDGGWNPVSAVIAAAGAVTCVVGWTCTIIGNATDNQTLKNVGGACVIIGGAVAIAGLTLGLSAALAPGIMSGVDAALLGIGTPLSALDVITGAGVSFGNR